MSKYAGKFVVNLPSEAIMRASTAAGDALGWKLKSRFPKGVEWEEDFKLLSTKWPAKSEIGLYGGAEPPTTVEIVVSNFGLARSSELAIYNFNGKPVGRR